MSQLEFYWKLSSNQKSERVETANNLLEFIKPTIESDDLDYALKRLLRGLPSSRDGSRQGFSLALCELLSLIPESVTCKKILDLLDEYTLISGSTKKREERDLHFGKLFGLLALVQSDMLNKPQTQAEDIQRIMESLLKISSLKMYMREACFSVMIQIIEKIQNHKSEIYSYITNVVMKSGIDSPELLWMAIKCQRLNINLDSILEQDKKWRSKTILSIENHAIIAELLKETTFAHPHIHSIWDCVIESVLTMNAFTIRDFWHYFVEGFLPTVLKYNLFDSSHERKYLGFQLFMKLLSCLDADTFPYIFTPKFMRTFTNNLSSKNNFLHKAAKLMASKLAELAKTDKSIGFQIIIQLTGSNGVQQFDRVTKSKTIESVATHLDLAGVEKYIEHLFQCFSSSQAEESAEIRNKQWALDQLYTLIRNGSVPKTHALVEKFLLFFTTFAFDQSSAHHGDALKKLSGMLTDLMNNPIAPLKVTGMDNGRSWAYLVINSPCFLAYTASCENLSAATKVVSTLTKDILSKISKGDNTQRELVQKLQSFESLLSYTLFMSAIDSTLCTSITDLQVCYSRLFSIVQKKRKMFEDVSEELDPHDVLLDILINFMSKPSALLRGVSESVFKVFCDQVTQHGFDLIFEVLEGKLDNEAEEEEEEDSDDELVHGDNTGGESDDNDDEDGQDSEEIKELKAKIAASAPGMLAGSDSDEEEFLDDEQMKDFDSKLVEIFKQRKEMKQAKKQNKDLVIHFKARLLDFVDIFIKKQPSNPLLLTMILPLLRLCMKSSGEFQIHEKLSNILKNKLVKVKGTPAINVDAGITILQEIHSIASHSSEKNFLVMCSGLCNLVVRSILANASSTPQPPLKKKKSSKDTSIPSNEDSADIKIYNVYVKSITEKMQNKQCELTFTFFLEFCSRFPSIGWKVCQKSLELANIDHVCKSYQLIEVLKLFVGMLNTLPKTDIAVYKFIIQECCNVLNTNMIRIREMVDVSEGIEKAKQINSSRWKEMLKLLNQIQKRVTKSECVFDMEKSELVQLSNASKEE